MLNVAPIPPKPKYGIASLNPGSRGLGDDVKRAILADYVPQLGAEFSQYKELFPQLLAARKTAFGLGNRALTGLTPGGVQGAIDKYRATATGNAQRIGRMAQNALMGSGVRGGAALGGANIEALNNAQTATNNFAADQMGPEADLKRYQAIEQVLSQMGDNADPELANILFSLASNTPYKKKGGLTLGSLVGTGLQAAGMASGMGWKPF